MKPKPDGDPCPFCNGKFRGVLLDVEVQRLYLETGLNAMSRRDGTAICDHCGKAEGLADRSGGTIDDKMARRAVANDWQEARRMPGMGSLSFPGGVPDHDKIGSW